MRSRSRSGWPTICSVATFRRITLRPRHGSTARTHGRRHTQRFGPQVLIAPPPSLAPYLLTAWLPVGAATWVWVGAGAIAAVLAVRALHLPIWWILFPPLLFDVFWGSIDPILLAFLVIGPRWLAGVFKVTFIPAILAERAWRDLVIVGVVLALSLVVLPWGMFLRHLPDLVEPSAIQSNGGTSAASYLPLAFATAVALIVLGWRRGWYLFSSRPRPRWIDLGLRMEGRTQGRHRGGRLPLRRPRLQGRRVCIIARGGRRASDLPRDQRRRPVTRARSDWPNRRCHCERSEAIQGSQAPYDPWIAASRVRRSSR